MPQPCDREVLEQYGTTFADGLICQIEGLASSTLAEMDKVVPELVGPDPGLRTMWVRLFCTNLESLGMAISHLTPLERLTVSPVTSEYARIVAQRGVPPHRLLMGQQICEHALTLEVMRCAAAVVGDRDTLEMLVNAVLQYCFAHSAIALQQGMEANAAVRASWQRGRGAGLSRRLSQVLTRQVTDREEAERMLGYRLSGSHLAVLAWRANPAGHEFDLNEIERQIRALPGVRDALIVPRDEQTVACWLRAPSASRVDDWAEALDKVRPTVRFALGEPASGLEGFLRTHREAQIAASVLVRAYNHPRPMIRYRDISAISFLIGHPSASQTWVEKVLGGLAGPGEDLEILRHTLHTFLEEGENATATAEQLFVHRNTVKYRIDRAMQLLPDSLRDHRLDVSLALTYCAWIPLWDESRPTRDNPVAPLDAVLDLR